MINKPVLVLGIITAVLFLLILGSILFLGQNSSSSPQQPEAQEVITPPNRPLDNPLQKSIIGKTTKADLQKYPVIAQVVQSDNSILYQLNSGIPQKPGEIIIKDGVVVYEKINIPANPQEPGYTNLPTLQKNYGPPERVLPGPDLYGPFSNIYIYASRGIAFTGNQHSGDVYDIEIFQPTSVENYLKTFPQPQTAELPKPETP